MAAPKKEIDENLIAKALEMHEAGKVNQEIISRLVPNGNKEELEEILECLAWVENEGKSISPSPLLLRTILAHVPHAEKIAAATEVPPISDEGLKKKIKERPIFDISKLKDTFLNKKIFLPVGAVAVVLFLFLILKPGSTPTTNTILPSSEATQAFLTKSAMENPVTIDEIFNDLDKETEDELSSVTATVEAMTPVSASALLDTGTIIDANETDKGVCERISAASADANAQISGKQVKFETAYNLEQEKQEQKLASTTQELKDKRDAAEASFASQVLSFSDAASTTEQKQAISDFQQAVEKARAARLVAVDGAVKVFGDAVASLTDAKKTASLTALQNFGTSVQGAFQKAQTDCASSISKDTTQSNLIKALNAAEASLKTNQTSLSKTAPTFDALVKTRRDSILKAFSGYKLSLRKMKADLRLVFPLVKK
ncbi:MAG: hypothetical protein PHS53_03705 [Candidatus Pacebacteria bacterium]|nr:hypothetical protein [Candidatus Paceibacterota bacterium]MDD5357222.1 hypothetical protein [Candidatus Paceibacterota bacterium]